MEMIHLLRAQGVTLLTKTCLAGVLLVTLYNLTSFATSTDAAITRSFSGEADVNLYGLIDDLRDADEFSAFRESIDDLERLASFYTALTSDNELTFLSSFDQPVPVRDFRGGLSYEYGYGTDLSTHGHYREQETGRDLFDAKSLQVNRAAFEFYNLETSDGQPLPWDSVDYTRGVTPVVLGDDYRGVYEVGERFTGRLYAAGVTFEVAGFLRPDSSIFYQGDIDYFLDDHIVIPYPERLEGLVRENQELYGIISFAMVNGDIAAAKSLTSADVLERLSGIAQTSGFSDYTLLNVSPYLTQFTMTKKIIDDNFGLVLAIELAVAGGVLFSVAVLDRYLFAREAPRYRIAWLAGASPGRVLRAALLPVLAAEGGVAVLLAVAQIVLPQHSAEALQPVFLGFLAFACLDVVHHGILTARLLRSESGKAPVAS